MQYGICRRAMAWRQVSLFPGMAGNST